MTRGRKFPRFRSNTKSFRFQMFSAIARTGFDERSNVARDFNVYTLMNRVNVYILVVYARVRGLVKIDIFLKIQVTVQRLGKRQRHFNHQETFNTSNNQTDDTFTNYNFQE